MDIRTRERRERERESRDSDSEELPPGPQVPGVIDTEYLSLKTSINLPLTDSDGALISTRAGKLNCPLSRSGQLPAISFIASLSSLVRLGS